MKHIFALFVLLLPPALLPAVTPDQDPVLLKGRLAVAEAQRTKEMRNLTETRMKHIRTDKNLKRMHDNIMIMHRNLALALDTKKDVREINDRLLQLDEEIKALQKKIDTLNKTEKTEWRKSSSTARRSPPR